MCELATTAKIEFANFGTGGWEYGNVTREDKPLSKEVMSTNFLRAVLMGGLRQDAKLSFVDSTDVDSALGVD